MPSGDAHRSLARALDILELCSLNGSGYTLTQLSQHLGIAKGSVIRFYLTAKRRGHKSNGPSPLYMFRIFHCFVSSYIAHSHSGLPPFLLMFVHFPHRRSALPASSHANLLWVLPFAFRAIALLAHVRSLPS